MNAFKFIQASFLTPIDVWLGFFIEFQFQNIDNTVLKLTTETNIIPDVYPFKDCFKEACKIRRH